MLSSLYSYLFSQSSLIVNYRSVNIIIRPGDECHCKSERFKRWFIDGRVIEVFQSGVKVRYGLGEYFGVSFTRGNTKYIPIAEMQRILRFPNPSVIKSALTKKEQSLFVQKLLEEEEDSEEGSLPM